MFKSVLVVVSLVALGSSFADGQQSTTQAAVIGKAGNEFITESEFLRRFELLPAFGRQRKSKMEAMKLDLLYSLIAEKLLAQEAEARNMELEPPIRDAIMETRKLLARDELYRREIIEKTHVSDDEIAAGVTKATRQRLISYIFTEHQDEADFLRQQMRSTADFQRLALDSSLKAVRDTATVIWGDADPAIEEESYALKSGEVSPVVAAGDGYYILVLVREQQSDLFSTMEPSRLAAYVQRQLQLRKEHTRLDEYLAGLLKGKTGYGVGKTLKEFSSAVSAVLHEAPGDSDVTLTPDRIDVVRARLQGILKDSLAVIDTSVWTVGEVLDRIAVKSLVFQRRDELGVLARLDGEIRTEVQRELIAREALRQGMDRVPEVAERMKTWTEYFLAEALKGSLTSDVHVTDADAWAYLKAFDSSLNVPCVRTRELRTNSLGRMHEALEALQNGMSFTEAIRQYSADRAMSDTEEVSKFFPVTTRYPIGELASQMTPGQRYGPVPYDSGYVYFELVEKDSGARGVDTALAARLRGAKDQMERLMRKKRVSLFLARTAQQRGFMVYEDRLKQLEVTPAPMMTFRILGFGGRMFEVPFLEQQLDWLGLLDRNRVLSP